MPFITIELSEQIKFDLQPFARALHHYLAKRLSVPIAHLKTKLVLLTHTYVGTGEEHFGYVRLKLELRKGRDRSLLIECQNEILKRLTEAIVQLNPDQHFRITVEWTELDPELLVARGV